MSKSLLMYAVVAATSFICIHHDDWVLIIRVFWRLVIYQIMPILTLLSPPLLTRPSQHCVPPPLAPATAYVYSAHYPHTTSDWYSLQMACMCIAYRLASVTVLPPCRSLSDSYDLRHSWARYRRHGLLRLRKRSLASSLCAGRRSPLTPRGPLRRLRTLPSAFSRTPANRTSTSTSTPYVIILNPLSHSLRAGWSRPQHPLSTQRRTCSGRCARYLFLLFRPLRPPRV
ncbi:hypothetical protein EDB92DRAFT_107448 [Lactarius akahatsu]|uniref:Uncharacterized protein n=1 Tax=Lactarius akahatsu TaxID=416441 RepID=A0AAD4LKM2_9AGAM|nr:hypothetical protein EDB92DRAFT_107448 [Lactarius akahatsu]